MEWKWDKRNEKGVGRLSLRLGLNLNCPSAPGLHPLSSTFRVPLPERISVEHRTHMRNTLESQHLLESDRDLRVSRRSCGRGYGGDGPRDRSSTTPHKISHPKINVLPVPAKEVHG